MGEPKVEIEGPFPLAAGEHFVECPYDRYHVITNHRILFHLQKCRRNYAKAQRAKGLEVEYGYCKFNYVHHLPLIELQFHESRCEDQYSVLQHIAYHSSAEYLAFRNKEVQKMEAEKEARKKVMQEWKELGLVESEEWENREEDRAGYNPAEKLANEPVFFTPRCLTKAERKQYRKESSEKFSALVAQKARQEGPKTSFVLNQPGARGDDDPEESVDMEAYLAMSGMVDGDNNNLADISRSQSASSVETFKWTTDETPQSTPTPAESAEHVTGILTESEQSLKSLEF